jgi:energy-coupling factor transport system ATP-binding protein
MGRNGAGKSTLLRHAAGLLTPTRGKVTVAPGGRVALLLQHPGDYLLHETVGAEAPASARERAGLHVDAARHPRDLSGGQRQRLALAVVLGDVEDAPAPAVLALDEPTRGMDRGAKRDLAGRMSALAAAGSAVLVATHDAEFAAAFADRVILMADGRPIADGTPAAVLSGGWYFATETARILGGDGGVLTPQDGAALLLARAAERATPAPPSPPLEVGR